MKRMDKVFFNSTCAQFLHSFPTVFHSFYTQDVAIDTQTSAYILGHERVRSRLVGERRWREVAKVLVRGISLGTTVLGFFLLSAFGAAPLSTAEAAQLSWGGQPNQAKRPLFRPLARSASVAPSLRWRPTTSRVAERTLTSAAAGRGYPVTLDKRMQQPLLSNRPQRRPSPPMPPAEGMGLRFRPDSRRGAAVLLRTDPAHATRSRAQAALHAQFRPQRVGQKKTYEQLHPKSMQKRFTASAPSWPYAANAYGLYRMPW